MSRKKKELPIIQFDTTCSERWAKENHITNPKYFQDRLDKFIELNKRYQRFKQGRFFINCEVRYVESSRRKGGYFSYINILKKNCLVQVYGKVATIFENNNSTTKMVDGKYFEMRGKEVTRKTYLKHSTLMNEIAERIKNETDRILQKMKEKKLIGQNKILKQITDDIIEVGNRKILPNEHGSILLSDWLNNGARCMDISENHPEIYAMKTKSGLSWREFIIYTKNLTEKVGFPVTSQDFSPYSPI